MKFLRRLLLPALIGGLGFLLGGLSPIPSRVIERPYPVPHHVPKYPGNLTLRFAMVHDVIHERFPRHGRDYYQARNRAAQLALQKLGSSTTKQDLARRFELLDDLAIGLSELGQHSAAVALLRKKLKDQQALGYQGKDLYSTYANLGTVLILWQLSEGVQDVPRAKARIKESVDLIHKAIEIFPESHFGREIWQLTLEQFLLAALDNPDLLLRYDMIGDRFDTAVEQPGSFHQHLSLQDSSIILRFRTPEEFAVPEAGTALRSHITRVGAEAGWAEAVHAAHTSPVPFDEPALGIVGMWRMGAGANPHFALALGEIMLRVGQRHIAWTAYERAYRLKEHYWPDRRIQNGLGDHCKARQHSIEKSLPEEDWPARRTQFEKDLARGQGYQKAYQQYETQRLAAGASVDDPNFYDQFDAVRDPIATPVGKEDKLVLLESRYEILPWRLFVAGLFAFLVAVVQTVLAKRWSKDRSADDSTAVA